MEDDFGYIRNCFMAQRACEVLFDLVNRRVMLDGFAILPLEMLIGDRLQELATEENQAHLREMWDRSSANTDAGTAV